MMQSEHNQTHHSMTSSNSTTNSNLQMTHSEHTAHTEKTESAPFIPADDHHTNSKNTVMSPRLMQALMNPIFPEIDSQLRAGRHISVDELESHTFLFDYEQDLDGFYSRYNVELIRAPEGFFYLRPRSTTLIPRSVLSELDMLVGKVLCYLYLSPERLANNGIFQYQDMYEELLSLAEESKLLRLVNNRSTGSDLDRQKLQEKLRSSMNRLRRLGMIRMLSLDTSKFTITEVVFRFGADVRAGDDALEAQLRLIRDGEAVSLNEQNTLPIPAQNELQDSDNAGSETDSSVNDSAVTDHTESKQNNDEVTP